MAKPVPAKIKKAEGDALRALIDAKINTGRFKSYQDFAVQSGAPGGKSMLSFALNAQRPITPDGAVLYAKTLGCDVRDFSSRIADLIGSVTGGFQQPQDLSDLRRFKRALVQRLCDLVESINDVGVSELIGEAKQLVRTHPLVIKTKRANKKNTA